MDFAKIRNLIFLGALVLVTLSFLYIVRPFIYPIFWAAVFAALFYPLYKKLNLKLKTPNLSATLTLIIAFFAIAIPLLIFGTILITQSVDIYNKVSTNQDQITSFLTQAAETIKNNPFTARFNFDESFWTEKFSEGVKFITSYIFTNITKITQNSIIFFTMVLIMLYTLYFFLRDGEKILKALMHLCPLGDKYEKILFQKFTTTALGTLKGVAIVGGLQAGLGALAFFIAGLQGALIWGLVMFVLTLLPAFSCSLVWFPAGMLLLLSGKVWQGIFMLSFGFFVISTIDNLLRPIVVGKESQIHPLLILFSMLGGIVVFGPSGFIIGPIIASLLLAFWEMYDEYYREQLDHN